MKNLIRSIIIKIVQNDFAWKIISKIFPFEYIKLQRRIIERDRKYQKEIQKYIKYFPEHKVINGPFSGMLYPAFKSVGSALFPKLLGSYEKEIHPIFYKILKNNYTEIIDVGCAEGYYAVGLLLLFPNAKGYAYDVSSEAKRLCKKMAVLNNVINRITIGDFFTPKQLANFSFSGRGLIVCDCEGYEAILFNIDSAKNLKNCDLIIELHDFKNNNITPAILSLFSNTHSVELINSIDDLSKVKEYDYPELRALDDTDKFNLLKEVRPQMSWVYLTPRINN